MKNIHFLLICAFLKISDAIVPGSSLLNSKIIGGASTEKSHKRYMASLRIKEKHFCCGFTISKRIVMSTGSCAYYMMSHSDPEFIVATVFVGNNNATNTYLGKVVDVDHAMYHFNYDPEDPIGTSSYDIGYILLKKQLPKLRNLGIICLSARNVQYHETYGMYGWGSDGFEDPKNELRNVPMSSNLKKLGIEITDFVVCEKVLERRLKSNQICGIAIREGETAAQGDAGSPLVRGYRFYGITTIVNIKGPQSPIVFIEARPFEEYMNDLIARFPEDEKCNLPNTNKKKSESSGVSENKKLKTDRAEELAKIFTYGKDTNGGKYGKCMECASSTGCERIIKMKHGNTSGIRYHLRYYHPELFKKIYGLAGRPNTQTARHQ